MTNQKQMVEEKDEKEDVITHLIKQMSNNEIFMDWIGDDPTCFVNGRREMRFLKCENGMVSYKMTIGFRRGGESDKEMATLLQAAMNRSINTTTRKHIYDSAPVSVRQYLVL